MRKSILTLGCMAALGACAGGTMKAYYAKSDVAPVAVEKAADDALVMTYRVFPETRFYSDGVNYATEGDVLKVYIDRCEVGNECKPMARTDIPLDDRWSARVRLPYNGGRVVVVHADGEEQVYP